MRYVIMALMIYLALALQTTLVDAITIDRIGPDIPAMVAVAIVILHGGNGALVVAATIGLLEDAICPGRMGIALVWYLLLSWGLLEISERFDLRTLRRRVTATGLFASLLALGVGITRYALGEPTVALSAIGLAAVGIGIYTAAAAVLFWLVLDWLTSAAQRRLARYEA